MTFHRMYGTNNNNNNNKNNKNHHGFKDEFSLIIHGSKSTKLRSNVVQCLVPYPNPLIVKF
jgi:hypothetical protein